MKCGFCHRNATSHLRHIGPACDLHFSKIVEKRFRKTIRVNKLIRKGDHVGLLDDGTVTSAVMKHFITRLQKDLPFEVNIVKKRSPTKGILAIPTTLDSRGVNFLGRFFQKKKLFEKEKRSVIEPMQDLSNNEIQTYASINNLLAGNMPYQTNDLQDFLDTLEKMYPETKFSLGNSMKELEGKLR